MAIDYSAEYQRDVFQAPPASRQTGARVAGHKRFFPFNWTNPATGGLNAVGDLVYLRQIPQMCSIVVVETFLRWTAGTSGGTFDVGYLGYTHETDGEIVADDNGLLDGLTVTSAGSWHGNLHMIAGTITYAPSIVDWRHIRSLDPVTLTLVFRDQIPVASMQVNGYFTISVS